jgi:multidrug efflux system outer membrane protein
MSPRNSPFGRAAVLLPLLGVSACVATRGVGPEYVQPETQLPDAYAEAEGAPTERRADWWSAFDDPELDVLVLAVREHNHELRAGLARLDQARALLAAEHDRRPSHPVAGLG